MSKSLRRLAADHASLHTKGLPPNYLFPPSRNPEDALSDLTTLTVLLVGPDATPFAQGLFTLTLSIPSTYPTTAPTASFKTKIFHPNVDPSTGAVCVETLKRDWKPELTLRDILVTVGCLLVFPNPASALNAEAGRLVEVDFEGYERKAGLWARMHAAIPLNLMDAVKDARRRGEEDAAGIAGPGPAAEKRRRRDREREREKERKVESEDVFVREDSIQTTPPKQFAGMAAPSLPPPPGMRGLGIDIMPESSLNAQLETPTQPPAPARRRKKPSQEQQEDEEQNAPAAAPTSFASTLPTPTPGFKPLIHSNPSTPRLGRPEPKRRRLTPGENEADEVLQRPEPVHLQRGHGADEAPWLSWQARSPLSSPEDHARRKRRKLVEVERLESVGGDLGRYNAGRFGPRIGVERL
jgi:ubiquitin-conjugating enzyme E2 S